VAGIAIQTPNFFGCVEDGAAVSKKAHAAGGLFIVSANPLSCGLLTPPGEMDADIAVGAAIAITPALLDRGGRLPIGSGGAVLLACVLIAGLLSSILAMRAATRAPLLASLRAE
jgi:hypothetical protein